MRYGVITGRVERDPCADLRGALMPVKTKNHAAITEPVKVGELLRAIDGYQGQPSASFALKIAPYVFARLAHSVQPHGTNSTWNVRSPSGAFPLSE